MTQLMLIKGYEWDGVNVFPAVVGSTLMNIMNQAQYKKSIDFIRIGDPILIDLTHVEALEYCYGCIVSDNTTFFITVTSIEVAKSTAVYLHYTVDWFTTLRHAGRLSFGRCHIIKSSDVNPNFYEQNVSPSDMRLSSIKDLNTDFTKWSEGETSNTLGEIIGPWLVITTVKDGDAKYVYSPLDEDGVSAIIHEAPPLSPRSTLNVHDIYSGEFATFLNVAPQDVTGIWVSPVKPTSPMLFNETEDYAERAWYDEDKKEEQYYGYTNIGGFASDIRHIVADINLTSTHMKKYYIVDNMGNPLYQLPTGRTLSSMEISTTTTYSSHMTHFRLYYTNGPGLGQVGMKMENSSFSIASPPVDYMNDTYKNWAMGLKGIEAEERRIQRNKALTQGIGGSALTGALGATAGPVGAVMGVAGGLGGALLSYGVDTYYESQTAEIEDKRYQAMPDTLMSGNYIVDYYGTPTIAIVELTARPEDISRYNAEIEEYGANCNLPLSSWTPKKGIYKFADVEIKGDFPYDIKHNIRTKLQQGIRLI